VVEQLVVEQLVVEQRAKRDACVWCVRIESEGLLD
jgi:hypothetical protein